jgi:hypothetical protein
LNLLMNIVAGVEGFEPPNIEDGIFSSLGFTLKDITGTLGKGFELT